MIKSLLLIFLFYFTLYSVPVYAKDAMPIAKHQKNLVMNRLKARMELIKKYNPGLYKRIVNNAKLSGGRLWHYNPRLYGRLPAATRYNAALLPRHPDIGRRVSMPLEFMPEELKPVTNHHNDQNGNSPASHTFYSASGKINLFGTKEVKQSFSTDTDGALSAFQNNINMPSCWSEAKKKAANLNSIEKLQYVNRFWNTNDYKTDKEHTELTSSQSVQNGYYFPGENNAIFKYYALKDLGFSPDNMRLVILKDSIQNQNHAVLAVYINNDVCILDDLSDTILSHKVMSHYIPQYSLNEIGYWVHMASNGRNKADRSGRN